MAVARSGQEVLAAQVRLMRVEVLLLRQVVAAEAGRGAAEVAAAVLLQFPYQLQQLVSSSPMEQLRDAQNAVPPTPPRGI